MIEKRINEKLVRSFLDLIVMTILNGKPAYGYEIISVVHKEFGVLLSPGTLYPLLHSLEEKVLIESSQNGGRIVYKTSSKGEQQFKRTLNAFNLAVEKMSIFIRVAGGGEIVGEFDRFLIGVTSIVTEPVSIFETCLISEMHAVLVYKCLWE